MALEIERKFIAAPAVLPFCRSGTLLVQGYLYTDAHNTLRVRRAGSRAFLTWKGPKSGTSREEVEYEVTLAMGEELLADVPLGERIRKTRYRIEHAGSIWDVDVFGGALDGLILAEIEMMREDQFVRLPHWVEREVTADQRYRNSRLAGCAMPRRLAARHARLNKSCLYGLPMADQYRKRDAIGRGAIGSRLPVARRT